MKAKVDLPLDMDVNPNHVRFIKLGRRGMWEEACIEGPTPSIRLGFNNPHHKACLEGDWLKVETYWKEHRPKEATKIVNQIRDFYTLGLDALWITFYKRKLYWCFAQPQVSELKPGGSRIRLVHDSGWQCDDRNGKTLFTDNLSGRLTQIQGFRGTICKVREQDYLLSRINGLVLEDVEKATTSLSALKDAIKPLIQRLTWNDFELLVDLIFARAGWQRISRLGKTEKSIDLELLMPVTGKRGFVQVKSRASLADLQGAITHYRAMEQFQEMFFIVHTGDTELRDYAKRENVTLLGIAEVASLVVDSGLSQWVIEKTS